MLQTIAFVNPLSNTKLMYNDSSSSLARKVTSEVKERLSVGVAEG